MSASNIVQLVKASYTALPSDETILYSGIMDGSQGITFPVTGISAGKVYTVKVISTNTGAGPLNVNTGNTAEWAANPQIFTIPGGATTGGIVRVMWDGASWWVTEYSQ